PAPGSTQCGAAISRSSRRPTATEYLTRCSTYSATFPGRSSAALTPCSKIQTRWRSTKKCCTRRTPPGSALMREFEGYVLDTQAHAMWIAYWYRAVPYRSYVKGWKISPSHFINQDLATIWLDK